MDLRASSRWLPCLAVMLAVTASRVGAVAGGADPVVDALAPLYGRVGRS